MRSLLRRSAATAFAVATLLWGADGLDREGVRLWLGYGSILVGSWAAYYALTGRTLLPERGPRR